MSKKLLEESTIRQFMKLASLEPLSENFFEEGRRGKKKSKRMRMREEDLSEEQLEEEQLEEEVVEEKMDATSVDPDMGLEEEYGSHDSTDPVMEEDVDAILEDELSEVMYEEEDDVDMEAEAGDMEAEINITPDQARAIIAVADMLKDIMPDLEAPEMDAEEEEEVEMPEPEMEPEAEEEEEVETPEGEEEEEEEVELQEESLEEQIMNRVKARLKELSNK